MTIDLSKLSWTVTGWAPMAWQWAISMENLCPTHSDTASVPAWVPGSVTRALREAGLLPDWNEGENALACEWVENRDWMFTAELPPEACFPAAQLYCEGLDGAGHILCNRRIVASFDNAFVPLAVDLGDHLAIGKANRLDIVFTSLPRALGQINRTSLITEKKPRFNYGWDWCRRMVQIGIWDRIVIRDRAEALFDAISCRAIPDGEVLVRAARPLEAVTGRLVFRLTTEGEQTPIDETTMDVQTFASGGVSLRCPDPKPWNPNGCGDRALYQVECTLCREDAPAVSRRWLTGFVSVRWLKNPGAPEGADPWLCEVNGKPLFLQGINWTPIRPNFADVTDEQVDERLRVYADMGCNLLRVWGGAVLEKAHFYKMCDRLGLMVIQEFPLSSSGIDNYPPDSPEAIRSFGEVAASYVIRRQSHPCLLAWCGGNEMQHASDSPREGVGIPIGLEHPMLAHFAYICRELDPERRFLPSSPSGPRGFGGEDFGQGLHWDVHGPWHLVDGTLEGQRGFWENDDALMRSEAGVPGATSLELMEKYAGGLSPEPYSTDNPFWRRYYWYHQYDLFNEAYGRMPESLAEFVEWSQRIQAEGLAIAAAASKRRFPACGGIIIWMGHDACPCPENTSIINFDGTAKPAVAALKKVFLS